MEKNHYLLKITLGPASFKRFAEFNARYIQKKFTRPLMIGGAGFLGSLISFASQNSFDEAFAIGTILFVIAFLVPMNFFSTFNKTVKEQTARMQIEKPRHVYTIELEGKSDGIRYYHAGEKKIAGQFSWKSITGVWRASKAIYLYVEPERALLIPEGTKDVNLDQLWKFFCRQAGEEKCHDFRSKEETPLLKLVDKLHI